MCRTAPLSNTIPPKPAKQLKLLIPTKSLDSSYTQSLAQSRLVHTEAVESSTSEVGEGSQIVTGKVEMLLAVEAQAKPPTHDLPLHRTQFRKLDMHQRTMVVPDRMRWLYLDSQGQIQGPWSGLEMHNWYKATFFTPDLAVKRSRTQNLSP